MPLNDELRKEGSSEYHTITCWRFTWLVYKVCGLLAEKSLGLHLLQQLLLFWGSVLLKKRWEKMSSLDNEQH